MILTKDSIEKILRELCGNAPGPIPTLYTMTMQIASERPAMSMEESAKVSKFLMFYYLWEEACKQEQAPQ